MGTNHDKKPGTPPPRHRAIASLHQACGQLTKVIERGDQLYQKLRHGRETFIQSWNATHPKQLIPCCRGAATNSACLRYTTNEQGLCDACRAELGKEGANVHSATTFWNGG